MRKEIIFALALFASAIPGTCWAQSTILQGGSWEPGHVPMYVGDGSSQPVVQDSGPAGGGGIGLGISEFLMTMRGPGAPPYSATGSGPLGTNYCDYDAPNTNATGYHYLCWSPNAGNGTGIFTFGAAGGASEIPLIFNINGINYNFEEAVFANVPNDFTAPQTFSVPPIFSSLTGYVYANGSGALTAALTIPNSGLANDSTTVNGVPCTLGSGCTITATAANALTFGTHLTGTSYNGSAPVTIGTDATSANTASTIMARDGSGNVSVNTLTGAVTGHSSLDLAISNNLSDLQSVTTARANLDLTPGTGLAISGSNLNLQPAQAATIGGVESIASLAHQWVAYIDTSGIPHQSQPAIGDISGLGTGVSTALGVNVGSAGAFVVNGGALGTPLSGVATNLTGTAAGLTAGAAPLSGITGLGSGNGAAFAIAANANGGPTLTDGTITTGDCLKWGPGVQDAGAACGSGGGNVTGTGPSVVGHLPSFSNTSATGIGDSGVPVSAVNYIPNASGSAQNTTATCTASSTSVALGAAIDFVNGQGIALEHCGAAFAGSAPTGLVVSATGAVGQGPTGSTTYAYQISCVDDNGGVGAAIAAVSITNGYATLGTITQSAREIAFNKVTWSTSCAGVAVWRNTNSAGYQLLGIFGSTQPGAAPNELDDAGLAQVTIPWIPATPPVSALNDREVTTIASGAGTTSIVVTVAPTNSASGAYARHDDTSALLTYLTAHPNAMLPAGTFNVEATTLPTTVGSLRGAGQANTIIQGWNGASTVLTASSMPNGLVIADLSIVAMAPGNVDALYVSSTSNCKIDRLALSGDLGLYLYSDTECIAEKNVITGWFAGAIVDKSGTGNRPLNNSIKAGREPTNAQSILIYGSINGIVALNELEGGSYFGIDVDGSSYTTVIANSIFNSLREGLHISGNATANRLISNYLNFGTSSIDYGMSMSDDGVNGITQNENDFSYNEIVAAGTSAIAIAQFGGTSPSFVYNRITNNFTVNSNADAQASTPEILLNGSGINTTFLNGNTFVSGSGRVNWLIQESNATYGYPSNTQVGTMFGLTGSSGTSSLAGTGSTKLTGGSTGL